MGRCLSPTHQRAALTLADSAHPTPPCAPPPRARVLPGCYKSETYGAMSLVKPCPSHVICSQIADLEKKHFCKPEEPYKVE